MIDYFKNKFSDKDSRNKILLFAAIGFFVLLYVGGVAGQIIFSDSAVSSGNPWATGEVVQKEVSYSLFRAIAIGIGTSHGRKGVQVVFLLVAAITGLVLIEKKNKDGSIFDSERNFKISDKGNYGTASWMSREELEKVLDLKAVEDTDGLIFGKKYGKVVALPKKSRLNRHVAVFGASGTGKSRSFARPYIIQAVANGESFYITDPKGEMFNDTAQYAKDHGYNVKILNLVNPMYSDSWAVLMDVYKSDKGQEFASQQFADAVIDNTTKGSLGQDFFTNSEKSLLKALVLYVINDESRTDDQKSFGSAYDLLAYSTPDDLVTMFDVLPNDHPAKAPWNVFMKNTRTFEDTMGGLGVRLQILQSQTIKDITGHDEIDITAPAKMKSAYYLVMDDQSDTLNFLSALFFTFTFINIVGYADQHGTDGKTDVPVNFILDEFPNIGLIPDFEKKLATIRSRDLRVAMIFQNLSQLSAVYRDGVWENLLGNCDTQLFLGCTDMTTAKYISERTGLITTETGSKNLRDVGGIITSKKEVFGESESTGSRVLLTPDEVLRLPNEEALLIVRGQNILRLEKFDFSLHPEHLKFREISYKDHVPEWRKKKEQQRLDLENEEDNPILDKIQELNIDDDILGENETDNKSTANSNETDISCKRNISYNLGDRVTENDFLVDINAVSKSESDIYSDFDEKVDLNTHGEYIVSLYTNDEATPIAVLVKVVGVVKQKRRTKMVGIDPDLF